MKPRSKLMKADEVLNTFLGNDALSASDSDLTDSDNSENENSPPKPVQKKYKISQKPKLPAARQALTPIKSSNLSQIKPKINENKPIKAKVNKSPPKPQVALKVKQKTMQCNEQKIFLKGIFNFINFDSSLEIKRRSSIDDDDDIVYTSDVEEETESHIPPPSSPVFSLMSNLTIKPIILNEISSKTPNKKRKRNS